MRHLPIYSDNPYATLDTRPQRVKDEEERLWWERRRKPQEWQPTPDPPNEDPWAKPPPQDPFAESQALHKPKRTDPMNEPAIRSGTLPEKIAYAQALATSNLLPPAYRQQPANVLIAIEMGEALGLVPIQAINSIHVIEGKPSASADLIAALIRRAGHKLRIETDAASLTATATLVRKDDPDFPFIATWNMDRAKTAGLAGKRGVWQTDPLQMLRNRTVTEVARMGASDVLYGVIYTPEELGVETDAEGNPIMPSLEQPQEDKITAQQTSKLKILLKELDMDREDGLAFARLVLGRHELTTSQQLTKREASHVIDALITAQKEGVQPNTGVVDADIVEEKQDELA